MHRFIGRVFRVVFHGLAERWNLTRTKLANAMLFSARLSHILLPSAVAHANLLRNSLPIRGLGKHTPYEFFFENVLVLISYVYLAAIVISFYQPILSCQVKKRVKG